MEINLKEMSDLHQGIVKGAVSLLLSQADLTWSRLAPEYERAAKNMKGLVNFAAIDCDQDGNKSLCVRASMSTPLSHWLFIRIGSVWCTGLSHAQGSSWAQDDCHITTYTYSTFRASRELVQGVICYSLLSSRQINLSYRLQWTKSRQGTGRLCVNCSFLFADNEWTLVSVENMPSFVRKLKTASDVQALLDIEVSFLPCEPASTKIDYTVYSARSQ